MNLSPDLKSVEIDCDGNIVSDISKSMRASSLSSPILTSMVPKEKCHYDGNYKICNDYLSYECFLQKSCDTICTSYMNGMLLNL